MERKDLKAGDLVEIIHDAPSYGLLCYVVTNEKLMSTKALAKQKGVFLDWAGGDNYCDGKRCNILLNNNIIRISSNYIVPLL